MSAKPMLKDDPQYVKAIGDLARLEASAAEARLELADLDQRIPAMEADPPGQAVDAAMDLVEGRRPPEATLVALRDDARQRLAVLQRGIDAQRKHITALAAEMSRQECERMRLEHARLSEQIAETG